MDDFTVTNGTVEYTRMMRPADFESKTPRVSLSFNVADGADGAVVAKKVLKMAVDAVEDALGGRLNAPEAEPKKVRRVPNPTTSTAPTPTPPTAPPSETSSDAAAIVDEDDSDILGPPPSQTSAEPATISDDDLHTAAQREGAKIKEKFGNIAKLRALINECGGEGHLLQIPQERRKEFVDKVKGISQSD